MKACAYCGQENEDAAIGCRQCGTALANQSVGKVQTARPRVNSNTTVAAGLFGGVFFIALTGLLVGPLLFGISEGAFLPLAGVALGAAVLSIYYQKQATLKIPRVSVETKDSNPCCQGGSGGGFVIPINMPSQPVKDSLRSSIVRVVWYALAGALTFSILIAFSEGFPWIGKRSEGGGLMINLFWLSLLMLEKLFLTPWGTIGALVGAGIGWLRIRARRGQDQRKTDE